MFSRDVEARRAATSARGAIENPAVSGDLAILAAQFTSLDDLQHAIAEVIAAAIGLPDSKQLFDHQPDTPF